MSHVERSNVTSIELVRLFCRGAAFTVAPGAGLCVTSLVAGGDELLALPAPLEEFLRSERTGGIPLLYPWANRLRGDELELFGQRISLAGAARCHRDGRGLPMHGLLLRWPTWSIERCEADDEGADFEAVLDWAAQPELMQAFPFPHRLAVRYRLVPQALEVVTRVEAGDVALPVSFGWHPYLALPAPRRECRVELPARRPVPLGEDGLPVLGQTAFSSTRLPSQTLALGNASFDDHFGAIDDGVSATLVGRAARRTIRFERGCRNMQLYAPRAQDVACIEPMTAATAALSDGAFPVTPPGGAFEATWRLEWDQASS